MAIEEEFTIVSILSHPLAPASLAHAYPLFSLHGCDHPIQQEIPDEEADNITTVQQAIDYIAKTPEAV